MDDQEIIPPEARPTADALAKVAQKAGIEASPQTQQLAQVSGAISSISVADLKAHIAHEKEVRELIKVFITESLVDGVDYGKIHIAKDCQNKYNCKNEYHYSKACLFKPGAEKFVSLFHLRAQFVRDTDTYEMAGNVAGLFCFECQIINQSGEIVGFGKGACSVAEKSGNVNVAIKIAKKRALIDAVLTSGALSDFFTQDLEDMNLDGGVAKDDKPAPKSNKEKVEAIIKEIQVCKNIEALTKLKPKIMATLQELPAVYQTQVKQIAIAQKTSINTSQNDKPVK